MKQRPRLVRKLGALLRVWEISCGRIGSGDIWR